MSELPPRLPPRQHLAAPSKWPAVGERAAQAPAGPWRVTVAGQVEQELEFSLDQLRALPQVDREIDIHCVTRWSILGSRFTGVLLSEILARARPRATARFVSFTAYSSRDHSTSLPLADALSLGTIVAWQSGGRPLEPVHGGPLRVVVPGRYFYKSLKWLRIIELLTDDALGSWEREAGYHNTGDPWREQRYLAPQLSRAEMQAALATRDFSGRDLRSLDARGHELTRLVARAALLRDADFRDCQLAGANFAGANLSNAQLAGANLADASFYGADVEGADFSGADLRGADFTGASLLGVTFFTSDITGAALLRAKIDSTTHFSPSAFTDLVPEQAAFVASLIGSRSTDG